jgi:DNA invertase Pin-like site-specific DNA recombinase
LKVALYARVSLEEGNKDDRRYQEPENQLEPLREWATRQGWEIIGEYVDRGSGADPNRKRFRDLLQDAMMMRFNTILVWKMDRFSREPLFTVVGRIQKLKERSIGIRSLTEEWLNTSADNLMGDLILSIMAWAAAEERRKISERTKAGIQRRRNIGQWKGGRPKKGGSPSGSVAGEASV